MVELTEQDFEDIRSFVFDNSENFPELEDLPSRMRRLRKTHKPEGHPHVEALRDELIQYYIDCSAKQLWAWAGLCRLLVEMKGKEPEPLRQWACAVVRDGLKPPPKPRGSKPEHDRNFRMELAWRHLQHLGLNHDEAVGTLSQALKYSGKGTLKENTVRSALRRGRKARMR